MNVLFLSFVIVQVRYLFGGESLIFASAGLTYAEYARRGFFELVTVTALVLPCFSSPTGCCARRSLATRSYSGSLVALLFVVMDSNTQRPQPRRPHRPHQPRPHGGEVKSSRPFTSLL